MSELKWELFRLLFFLECNGELSNETRISMSLVRITVEGKKIQTGAYSNICKKIFTLKTEDIEKYTNLMVNRDLIAGLAMHQIVHDIKAYNGIGENKFISHRTDDGENMINLMVS